MTGASAAGGASGGGGPAARALSATWAVLGKVQGSTKDYHVLAAHGGHTEFYDGLIRGYLPGTPVDPVHPPPTPHYVFWPGPAAPGGAATVNFSRSAPADVRDSTGRGSMRLAFFSVLLSHAFGDAAENAAGYADLAAAMDRAADHMPSDQAEFARLDVLPTARATAERADSPRDFAWLAAGAAALLAGRVVITGADGTTAEDRVRALDAIGGLLPYGARMQLAAATFARGTGLHGIRLFFDDLAPAGAYELPWAAVPPEPPPGAAGRYLELLREYHAGHPASALYGALLHAAQPCSLDDPGALHRAAARALRPQDDVTAGFVAVPELASMGRELLSRPDELRLAPETRLLWWGPLLEDAPPGAAARVLRALDLPVEPGTIPGLARDLSVVLASPDEDGTAAAYWARAQAAGLLPELLTALLRFTGAAALEEEARPEGRAGSAGSRGGGEGVRSGGPGRNGGAQSAYVAGPVQEGGALGTYPGRRVRGAGAGSRAGGRVALAAVGRLAAGSLEDAAQAAGGAALAEAVAGALVAQPGTLARLHAADAPLTDRLLRSLGRAYGDAPLPRWLRAPYALLDGTFAPGPGDIEDALPRMEDYTGVLESIAHRHGRGTLVADWLLPTRKAQLTVLLRQTREPELRSVSALLSSGDDAAAVSAARTALARGRTPEEVADALARGASVRTPAELLALLRSVADPDGVTADRTRPEGSVTLLAEAHFALLLTAALRPGGGLAATHRAEGLRRCVHAELEREEDADEAELTEVTVRRNRLARLLVFFRLLRVPPPAAAPALPGERTGHDW